MNEAETSLQQQIKELQAQLLALQHDLPDSAFQPDLQRLQGDLRELLLQRQPLRTPRETPIQPVPPGYTLTPGEATTFQTFSDFHKALLQYSGGGPHMPRGEWLRLANTAAEMSTGLTTMPATGGPYGWNATTQQWVPVVNLTGRTDGSSPAAGQVGEWISPTNLPASGAPYPVNVAITADMNPIGATNIFSTTLSAGDWNIMVGAVCDPRVLSTSTATMVAAWVGLSNAFPVTTSSQMLAGNIAVTKPAFSLLGVNTGWQRLSLTAPTTVYVVLAMESIAADIGKIVTAAGIIWGRRMS